MEHFVQWLMIENCRASKSWKLISWHTDTGKIVFSWAHYIARQHNAWPAPAWLMTSNSSVQAGAQSTGSKAQSGSPAVLRVKSQRWGTGPGLHLAQGAPMMDGSRWTCHGASKRGQTSKGMGLKVSRKGQNRRKMREESCANEESDSCGSVNCGGMTLCDALNTQTPFITLHLAAKPLISWWCLFAVQVYNAQ